MVIDAKDVVIRFAGDSGDGMQLTGSLFADMSAIFGNSLSTFIKDTFLMFIDGHFDIQTPPVTLS